MIHLPPEERLNIAALLTEFDWRIDHGEDLGDLFTPDGVLLAPAIGLELRGRDIISAHFNFRGSKFRPVTRHISSGLRLIEVRKAAITITTTQMTYLRQPGEALTAKHLMIGETRDLVELMSDGQWRFSERQLDVMFPFDTTTP